MERYKFHQKIKCKSAEVLDEIMEAIERTREIAIECKFHKNDVIYLQLVTEEACYNAFEYCQQTNTDEMTVKWSTDHEKLKMSIIHVGEPFEIKRKEEVNYEKRGRGLQLILSFMDDVWVETSKPNVELKMEKYLNDGTQKRTG